MYSTYFWYLDGQSEAGSSPLNLKKLNQEWIEVTQHLKTAPVTL